MYTYINTIVTEFRSVAYLQKIKVKTGMINILYGHIMLHILFLLSLYITV